MLSNVLTKIWYATDVKDLAEGTLHFGSNVVFFNWIWTLQTSSSIVITAGLINRSASKRTNTPGTSHSHTHFWFTDEGCYKFKAYHFHVFLHKWDQTHFSIGLSTLITLEACWKSTFTCKYINKHTALPCLQCTVLRKKKTPKPKGNN